MVNSSSNECACHRHFVAFAIADGPVLDGTSRKLNTFGFVRHFADSRIEYLLLTLERACSHEYLLIVPQVAPLAASSQHPVNKLVFIK